MRMMISYNLQCVFLFAIIFITVQDESIKRRSESAANRETARKSRYAGSGRRSESTAGGMNPRTVEELL